MKLQSNNTLIAKKGKVVKNLIKSTSLLCINIKFLLLCEKFMRQNIWKDFAFYSSKQ